MNTVVVLCGGKGTRLQSLLPDKPKCLAEINDVPFISILLEQLKKSGFDDFILCTGYKHEAVEYELNKSEKDCRIRFSREERPLLTGGALTKVYRDFDDLVFPILVMNGDTIIPKFDYNAFLFYHDKTVNIITIATNKSRTSAGVYLIERGFFNVFKMVKFSLEDKLQAIINKNNLCEIVDSFYDIGTPEGYFRLINDYNEDSF